MSKKSTPTNLPKPRKVAAGPNRWPAEYEDVDHMWARDAIFHGNGAILARYLREADEIDPRIRRELGEMLDPKSNHNWRLEARYRFRGKPENRAKRWKTTLSEVLVPLARLLSGTDTIDAEGKQALAQMLDPKSRHALRLDFKQRKSGRPRLEPQSNYRPVFVPAPIEDDTATRIAKAAECVRDAKKGGTKVPLKQLQDGTSRATFYRRWKPKKKAHWFKG
jgi:hypothetical protein